VACMISCQFQTWKAKLNQQAKRTRVWLGAMACQNIGSHPIQASNLGNVNFGLFQRVPAVVHIISSRVANLQDVPACEGALHVHVVHQLRFRLRVAGASLAGAAASYAPAGSAAVPGAGDPE
jgi:hypothetical protein